MTWLFKNIFGKTSGNGSEQDNAKSDFDPDDIKTSTDTDKSADTTEQDNLYNTDNDVALDGDTGDLILDLPMEDLSDAEAESILALIVEEKLALDVYSALADEFDLDILDNLEAAENVHLSALTALAEKYNLDSSVADLAEGVYNDETFQELYNELVAQGSQSQEAALEIIALIEEMDIADLIDYSDDVDNQDISLVYTMLQDGSENHLAAVLNLLEDLEIDYSAQELTQDQIDEILEQSLGHYGDIASFTDGDYLN